MFSKLARLGRIGRVDGRERLGERSGRDKPSLELFARRELVPGLAVARPPDRLDQRLGLAQLNQGRNLLSEFVFFVCGQWHSQGSYPNLGKKQVVAKRDIMSHITGMKDDVMSEYEELLKRLLKEARPYIEKEKAARVPIAGYLDENGINHITNYQAEDRPEAKNLLDRIDAALEKREREIQDQLRRRASLWPDREFGPQAK